MLLIRQQLVAGFVLGDGLYLPFQQWEGSDEVVFSLFHQYIRLVELELHHSTLLGGGYCWGVGVLVELLR